MEARGASVGRRKRALDEDEDASESPRAITEDSTISPRLCNGPGAVPAGNMSGATSTTTADRGRAPGAVKSRRLSRDFSGSHDSMAQFAGALSVPPLSLAPPGLRVVAPFVSDGEAASTPLAAGAPFARSPLEMKQKLVSTVPRSLFVPSGHPNQIRPVIAAPMTTPVPPLVSEQKASPPSQLRRMEKPVAVRQDAAGASPMGDQEQKASPPLNPRLTKPVPLRPLRDAAHADLALPALSHFLVGGQDAKGAAAFGSLSTPYRASTTVSTTAPSSKQVTKRQPFPFPHGRSLDAAKTSSTPLLDPRPSGNFGLGSIGIPPFDDVPSSDEELLDIPGPDIPDPEISFSQEKLGDLSFSENYLEETVMLTLCDDLASTLTKKEREGLERLNMFTIALTKQPSPITLGRDPFHSVFGDNIRGGMTFHLSRRHCLVYVEKTASPTDKSKTIFKVRVENTSTNGIEVNGQALKNGQSQELELDDVVTLLRIHGDQGELALAYKLTHSLPVLEHDSIWQRKSRHDGRYVRPADKFSCELADISNSHGADLPTLTKSDIAPTTVPVTLPSGPHELLQQVAGGDISDAQLHAHEKRELTADAGVSIRQVTSHMRNIRCTILFAGQSTQDFSCSSQPLEEANYDYREELSEVLSTFSSISSFDASSYHCATVESIRKALEDDSDVVFYAGGGDENHVVIEAVNGMPARLEKDEIRHLISKAEASATKLIVVISPSSATASMLAECGAAHVCYLNSSTKQVLRATAFIRALFAGLLKGFSIEKSYTLAEFVALNDLLPIVRSADQICGMFPNTGQQHAVEIGSPLEQSILADKNAITLLNAPFIPVLATHFLGRESEVGKVKTALMQKVHVCNVHGARGVGKSSVAIRVARWAYRTRGYIYGVHFFPVDKLVEHVQNCLKPSLAAAQNQDRPRHNQREDVLRKIVDEVEALLRSLPDDANVEYPSTLLVLDGCDVILPAFGAFVAEITQRFLGVQILLTSTQELKIDTNGATALPEQAVHVKELSGTDSAKLFFKLARSHLTPEKLRQHFPVDSIDAISNHDALQHVNGNPFLISRLPYALDSQPVSGNK